MVNLWATKIRAILVIIKPMVTKNFWLLQAWHWKILNYRMIGDQNFWSPIVWWLIFFNFHKSLDLGHSINNGLISTLDLVTKFGLAMEFGLPNNKMETLHVNTHFLLWGVWTLCCLTPRSLPYTLGAKGETFMGVRISNRHIAFAINAQL